MNIRFINKGTYKHWNIKQILLPLWHNSTHLTHLFQLNILITKNQQTTCFVQLIHISVNINKLSLIFMN